MRQLILAISLCLLGVLPVQAATIFTEDFEVTAGTLGSGATRTELNTRGWTITCSSTPCTADVVTGNTYGNRVHSGTKALRMTYNGAWNVANEGNNMKLTQNPVGFSEYWERYWVYFECFSPVVSPCGFNLTNNGGGKQHYVNNTSYPNFYTIFGSGFNKSVAVINQKSVASLCPAGTSSVTCNLYQTAGSNQVISFNAWHCIETHFGQANGGIVEAWVDGNQVLSYTANIASPALFNAVQIYKQASDNLYRYEDDFKVATTRTEAGGCGAQQSGDTTPPSPPSNLAVQ